MLPVDDRLLEDFRMKLAVLGPGVPAGPGAWPRWPRNGDLDTIGSALADLGGSLDDLEPPRPIRS